MANLALHLNIYSAKDLENVNLITKMDVYAVVWINGDDSQKNHKEKTPVDRTGGSEPTWNHVVKFSVDQRLAREGRLTLVVKLFCDRIFGGKDLGEVKVPILELLNSPPSFNGNGQGMMRFVTYQVRTPCRKGQGSLTFSYRFDMPSFKPDIPVTASPVYSNPMDTPPGIPSFKPDIPVSASPVYSNPIDTPPDMPSPTTTYPPPTTTYPPPQSEASLYPSIASIGYPPSSQPQGYSSPPYPYPNPNPNPHHYDSHYPEQPVTVYPPPSPSASNLYPPPYYITSPQHQSYRPHPDHSYHQVQASPSFHGYAPSSPQNQHGYCYPPRPMSPGHGYGSPTTQAPPKKNNRPGLGLGIGAGLLGGALGGLLIDDIGFDF